MTNGSNSAVDRAAALQAAEDFGNREGSGSAARAGFYYDLTEMSKGKRLDVADAPDVWDRFHEGAKKGASMIGGVKQSSNPTDTRKVRVSETRLFLKLGALTQVDGLDVLSRAVAIIKAAKQAGDLSCKATDAMINVARAQCDDPNNTFEDDDISRTMKPKESPDKDEPRMLNDVCKKLEAIMKKFGEESDEVLNAIQELENRIVACGGTVADRKAKKKAKV